jgi:hypothetical protein
MYERFLRLSSMSIVQNISRNRSFVEEGSICILLSFIWGPVVELSHEATLSFSDLTSNKLSPESQKSAYIFKKT